MAYIRVIDEDEAEGPLFDVYDEIQKTRGRVSNVLRIQSLHPKALRNHLDLYMTLVYGKGPLSRMQRELVAVVVSRANGCDYCVTHHAEALSKHVDDKEWVRQASQDHRKLEMGPLERALCDYAEGLTLRPSEGRKEAVAGLRDAGLDDEAILHVTEVVAYFNFVNRLVHGLGVDLEGEDARDYNY